MAAYARAPSAPQARAGSGRVVVALPRDLELEPGSYRDRDSRVFTADDVVYRALTERGLADWRALRDSRLLERLGDKVVATDELDEQLDGYAGVLRHEQIPFVSYPYEWPFSMLRDAALLQLELLLAALDASLTLKDASPYNVQWRGTRPVFVDVGSFEPLRAGEPWAGYRQFCMLFLYPLLVHAWRGIDYRPLLRGSIEGIAPAQARRLLGGRDLMRRGALTHVVLHARLEERNSRRRRNVKAELRRAGFSADLVKANARRLHRLVTSLEPHSETSAWSDYGSTTSYAEEDARRKEAFVRDAIATRRWPLAWDLGCNDGRFSRIAAEHAEYVVAVDADASVVDRLYRDLAENRRIVPLAVDLADPSPALGWRGRERRTLLERGRPDLVLALALVHHLSIGANVPLGEVVEWLASLRGTLVVEFPQRDDPMVQRLLSQKMEGANADYSLDVFEDALRRTCAVERREELQTRVLYLARPRE